VHAALGPFIVHKARCTGSVYILLELSLRHEWFQCKTFSISESVSTEEEEREVLRAIGMGT